jgi:hypothetical protein
MESSTSDSSPQATRLSELPPKALNDLLHPRGLVIVAVDNDADIPGSYWGAPEAGIIGNTLYVRSDTPVHSALHTACHWICMEEPRRHALHTNAGGDDVEEAAVCYLQCLLADELTGYSCGQLFADMDAWGYSFRLGSARAWFTNDAEDARTWLLSRGVLRVG